MERGGGHIVGAREGQQWGQGPRPCSREGARRRWQTNTICIILRYAGPPFFRGKFCQILRCSLWNSVALYNYPQIPCIPRSVGVVVLTDSTSPYKEFIENVVINFSYHKSKLTTSRLYCFKNGKIKKEPEKPWFRYKYSKNGQLRIFPWQAASSTANSEFCGTVWKSTCHTILLALVVCVQIAIFSLPCQRGQFWINH